MGFRFIHTADWQIGKPFGSFPDETAFELRSQRLRAIRTIADQARLHDADAVLIAGDAFDDNKVSNKTISQVMEALQGFAGPWVFLPGNHDAAIVHSVWTRLRDMGLPPNVVIADTPEIIDRWAGRAHILPAPLQRRREAHDLTGWFDEAGTPDGGIRIGLAHGSVANRLPGESSNEIAEDRAERAGLGYLALGDWHGALEIAPRTHYSGTPEPDRHRANDPGFVNLVTFEGATAPARVERLRVGRFSWVRLEAELLDGGCGKALDLIEATVPAPRDTVLSLRVSGSISLAERRRLQMALDQWDARLHHLEVEDRDLLDEPTADDLDAIDTTGFVRLAVDRLKLKASDPRDPEAAAARLALRMIYLDHLGDAPAAPARSR